MKAIIVTLLLSFCIIDVCRCASSKQIANVIHGASVQLTFPADFSFPPGACGTFCPEYYKPVCGFSICLGLQTFANKCFFNNYNSCHADKYVSVADESCESAFRRQCFWKTTNA